MPDMTMFAKKWQKNKKRKLQQNRLYEAAAGKKRGRESYGI